MSDPNITPLPPDLGLLRCLFRVVPRGHRLARTVWSPRLRSLGIVSVPTRLGFTLLVRLTDVMGWALAMHPNYEGPVTSLMANYLQRGGVFADVGANHGWFSLYAAKLLDPSRGRVFAFEPQADLAELIRQAAVLNQLHNLTVIQAAAADAPTRGRLQSGGDGNSGYACVVATGRASDPITMVTLDEELLNTPPTVVKIDVEGGEFRVLRGMTRLLSCSSLSCIIIEVHPEKMLRLGDTPGDLLELLRAQGFRTHLISMNRPAGTFPQLRELSGDLPEAACLNLLASR